MNANDIETTLRARAAFNDSVERIDVDTRHQLRELRLQALNHKPRRARWMWPATAALTAAIAVLMFIPRMPNTPAAKVPAATAVIARPATAPAMAHPAQTTMANEIAASDPIEIVDPDMLSDLDFYGWLAKQPSTDATGG